MDAPVKPDKESKTTEGAKRVRDDIDASSEQAVWLSKRSRLDEEHVYDEESDEEAGPHDLATDLMFPDFFDFADSEDHEDCEQGVHAAEDYDQRRILLKLLEELDDRCGSIPTPNLVEDQC
jgi:hypothetical protein